MVTLHNPTTKTVTITFEGTEYSILAGGSLSVSATVAEFWLLIHQFLTVQTGTPSKKGLKTIGGGQDNVPAVETPIDLAKLE